MFKILLLSREVLRCRYNFYYYFKPSSGAKWPQSASDWTWLVPGATVPTKLAELVADGYRLVFITNQGGIEKGKAKLADIQRKVELIIGALDLPVLVS